MARTTEVLRGKEYAGVGYSSISTGLPDARCCRLTGPTAAGAPPAGGRIDGVTGIFTNHGSQMYFPAMPGGRVQVEAAAAFAAGATLRTDADGRVRTASGGDAQVLRALEAASGAGELVWCVFV